MEKLKEMVREGEMEETIERVKQLLEQGKDADDLLKNALIPAMDEVGKLFQDGEYYIPELLVAARAMKAGVEILKPLLVKSSNISRGKIVLCTVKGDRHDIGKTLVAMTFEGAGFEVVDLGVDIPPEKILESIKIHKPIVLALSALLTSTMLEMKEVVEAIKKAGLRDTIKIVIGGAPVTDRYAKEIGADFYGEDPLSAKDYILNII